ncbi:MAG TPA: cupredoxin domain-containing protein [Stellaceae bacterium]|jgi:uncharacterized cupredoxin-like copper-binding protein|nr:cupredoxin domain-containing protein [Stellaceae bacterium]
MRLVIGYGCAVATLTLLSGSVSIAADVDWSKAQPLTVVTKNYKFVPKHLKLKSGTAYRLHIENKGNETHEFNAAKLFRASNSEIGDMSALNADHTEVVVQPGGQKDLLLLPKKPGRYKLVCPDHDWAGMTGDITVE